MSSRDTYQRSVRELRRELTSIRGGDMPDVPAPARRLTLSAILELMLQRGGRDHSSVTLSRNARGETQIEVVVRTGDGDDVATVDAACAKARELYDDLRAAYPTSGGTVGATAEHPARA